MALALGLDVSHAGSSATVVVRGELDVASAPELVKLLRLLAESGSTDVVLDMGHLGFVDSHGLDAVAAADVELAHRGGRVLVRNPSRLTRHLLAAMDLLHVLAEPALTAG
ncbi:MAG: hypothetical protein QOK43_2023 [Acidimicrobiaceae bacterium]|nr:hypothetical protein [Acidimicrobiaceae bacterium]